MAAFPVHPPGCPNSVFQAKKHEGCRSAPAFCKPCMMCEELDSTGSTSCQVLPSFASFRTVFPYREMDPGASSWLHLCTVAAFCFSAILSSLCHEHDQCCVFLLSPHSHHGEKGQQVSSSSSDVLGIHIMGAVPFMVAPLPSSLSLQERLVVSCPHCIFWYNETFLVSFSLGCQRTKNIPFFASFLLVI